ncbi:MAG: TonB-dependent receptor [Dysgonamonadaceae bacterium]
MTLEKVILAFILVFFVLNTRVIIAQEKTNKDTLTGKNLNEVNIITRIPGTILNSSAHYKAETITHTGLKKMACCNLSESFENSASVSVGYTDAITGAKQIQLLGLSGVYGQFQAENIPVLRGLSSPYGLKYVPASWLESIQISKGTSSVINGYESITGQINLEFKKPNNTEPIFINLYTDQYNHYEGNVTSAIKLNDKLWTGLLMSGTVGGNVHDHNGDAFLDMPESKYVNAYNRWFYLDDAKGIQSRTGIKFFYEHAKAGQDSLHHVKYGIPVLGIKLWKSLVINKNITIENKTGFAIGNKEGQSLGIINSFSHYAQNSGFGDKTFNGTQNSYYGNILFTSYLKSKKHHYTVGASLMYDNYETEFSDALEFNKTPLTSINRKELVPGAFLEYSYTPDSRLTVVLGGRADHNSRYGWLLTPRLNVKYELSKLATIRISAGRGFHSENALSENISLMASSRKFNLSGIDSLGIEKAWNFGANLTFNIPVWNNNKATLSLDYFHTRFQNQLVVDTERDRHAVFFYNTNGAGAYANAWQADLSSELAKGIDLFAAFRYSNNRITYSDGAQSIETEKPLSSSFRGLVNLSFYTPLRRWVLDLTAQLNGPTRLPNLNGYYSQKMNTPSYPIYFAQMTYNSKRLDLYLGAENIFSYKQKYPIRAWESPFSQEFDASMVWGPITGTRVYGGIRIRLGKLY